jgi:hypothetical protein
MKVHVAMEFHQLHTEGKGYLLLNRDMDTVHCKMFRSSDYIYTALSVVRLLVDCHARPPFATLVKR